MNCKALPISVGPINLVNGTKRDQIGRDGTRQDTTRQANEICGQTVTESLACNIGRGAVVDGRVLVTGCCLQEKRSVNNIKEHEISKCD